MKKINLTVLLIGLCIILGKNLATAQTTYSNTAIKLYNAGLSFQRKDQLDLAEKNYLQALKIQPNFSEAKNNLVVIYQKISNEYSSYGDYNNALLFANKALKLRPKDTISMNNLALIYIKTNQPEKATNLYNAILKVSPNNKTAQQNIKYTNHKINERVLNNSINNVATCQTYNTAPQSLYKLIKPNPGVNSQTVNQLKKMIDLTWSEPNGRMMLQAIIDAKVPINIIEYATTANMAQSENKHTFYYLFIPVYSYNTSSRSINIPFNYISDFYNPQLPAEKRTYCLHTFIHELGHAYKSVKRPQSHNSIEEELGVSMIGYNISYKIITGEYLSKTQTEEYSMNCLESLLKDSHKTLPVYGNFNLLMQTLGIQMPYPEVYTNLPKMYNALINENKIRPVANFAQFARY